MCPGYNNEEMIKKYQEELRKHPPKKEREHRKEIAKSRHTVEHQQGKTEKINIRPRR
jgi:hypothetical protein